MIRRLFVGATIAATSIVVLAAPVWAHGDHDARPLARQLQAGPYVVSLWQVYPDAGAALTPHLIVMLDGETQPERAIDIRVAVNSTSVDVLPSTTTAAAWETAQGLTEGDVVTVTVGDGSRAWELDPVVVPPPPTSLLPMQELIYISIFLSAGTALWVAGRTARAWRRPALRPS